MLEDTLSNEKYPPITMKRNHCGNAHCYCTGQCYINTNLTSPNITNPYIFKPLEKMEVTNNTITLDSLKDAQLLNKKFRYSINDVDFKNTEIYNISLPKIVKCFPNDRLNFSEVEVSFNSSVLPIFLEFIKLNNPIKLKIEKVDFDTIAQTYEYEISFIERLNIETNKAYFTPTNIKIY